MDRVNWGIIGCGDVAEVKSGPAFQKTDNSSLLAVMRRNGSKAADFAKRHHVPQWYDDAEELLDNSAINAVYIATPPSTHLQYALKALKAKKNVYLEKPMALSINEAEHICKAVEDSGCKLTVAHYRRRLPAFIKVKELLEKTSIGRVLFADLQILQPTRSALIAKTEDDWRTNPLISGGGYFHDISPHQIDLMYYFFEEMASVSGFSQIQDPKNKVDDLVNGIISFKSGVQFRGVWSFNVAEADQKEECVIYGSKGKIVFSFFGDTVTLVREGSAEIFQFQNPPHVQQPMIEATVKYFLGHGLNPCSADEGLLISKVMDTFCAR